MSYPHLRKDWHSRKDRLRLHFDPFESRFHIRPERTKGTIKSHPSSNQNVIATRSAIKGKQFRSQSTQSPLDTIPFNGIANFLGYGKAKANNRGSTGTRRSGPCEAIFVTKQKRTHASLASRQGQTHAGRRGVSLSPHTGLKDQAWHDPPLPRRRDLQKLRAFAECPDVQHVPRLSRQALTALGSTVTEDTAATNSRSAGTEAMTTFADENTRLKCALHGASPLLLER